MLKPPDKISIMADEQNLRLQRTVNVDVASLHANPMVETVYNVRRQQVQFETSLVRLYSSAGYQRWHEVKVCAGTREALDVRRRKTFEEICPITLNGKWADRHQGGGSGRSTVDRCVAKRTRREGPGPISNTMLTVR